MIIRTNAGKPCQFWLARVGTLVGKPLREPYTSNNSFSVFSDDSDRDFARLTCLYLANEYYPYVHGSVLNTLRIRDAREVIKLADHLDMDLVEKMTKAILGQEALKHAIAQSDVLINQLAQATTHKARIRRIEVTDLHDNLHPNHYIPR